MSSTREALSLDVPGMAAAWLQHLIGRTGWHQYVVREGGEIVGARCMYADSVGMAWLGMDGPVPGVMTDDYAPDAALCAAIVADGLALGRARRSDADIEASSPGHGHAAVDYFGRLGFRRPGTRGSAGGLS